MKEFDVNQYKRKCETCKTEQDIIEIIIDEHGGYEILILCGHKEVGITVCDNLHLIDDIFIRHKNSCGHRLSRDKTKIIDSCILNVLYSAPEGADETNRKRRVS
jgi:hypothetical protein